MLASALTLVILLSGCGSDLDSGGPTVAPDRFGGLFSATTLRLGGVDEQPQGPIVFDIDSEFGALAVETPCGTLLGSFTLLDDGEASITIAGRSSTSCPDEAEAQVGRLQTTLGDIDAWTDNGNGFDLHSPGDDLVSLTG